MLELPVPLFTAPTRESQPARPRRSAAGECLTRDRGSSSRPGSPAPTAASPVGEDIRAGAHARHTRADAAGGLIVAPVQPRRGEIIVRAHGEVDLATTSRLQAVLEQAVTAVASESRVDASQRRGAAPPRVVCDLDAVTFLSAAGLTVLLRITELAAAHGVGWMVIASCRPVCRVVELTNLDQLLPLRPADRGCSRPTA
ncbi:STAS domain-containing protein [Actinomycetospora sp. CA-101289]|uniref:STAS domain-containing protein n=1 Tax=Actinomycetospora sp. CA-101289 TaxID=3239893 RepID=UPI003D997AC2